MNKIVHFVHSIEKGHHLLYIRGQRKYLNEAERIQFGEAALSFCDPVRQGFCLTLLFTGCRLSEALNLKVSDIDFCERVIVVRTLKQREDEKYRALPMKPELLENLDYIIVKQHLKPDDLIFPCGRTWGWKRIKECMKKARLDGIKATPRGLRHAFGVSCVEDNVPLTEIQELMGHAKIETTKIYLTLVGKEKHAMVSRTWPKLKNMQKNLFKTGRYASVKAEVNKMDYFVRAQFKSGSGQGICPACMGGQKMVRDQAAVQREIDEVIGMYMMLMRVEGKLGRDEICSRLEISPSRLRSYERGELPIPASKLYLFAHMVEANMDFFFMDLMERLGKG